MSGSPLVQAIQERLRGGGYSDLSNHISDLGNFHQSPAYRVFNGSIILLGLAGLFGTALIRSAFARRRSSRIGLAFPRHGG